MKKNIIYVLLIVFFSSSCSDFLEETNYSGLSEDPFYNTEVGIEALINSCYTPIRFWYGKEGGATLTELGTDLFVKGGDCHHPEYSLYDISLNAQSPVLQVYWDRFYAAINYCNTALARLDNSPLAEDIKTLRKGEVYFLRAFYYWHITELWGEVHLTTTPSEGVQTEAYKTSKDQIYDQIFEDLDEAIKNLESRIAHEGGRITKPAAEAFKARMLLTRGRYAEAAELADKVISDYDFELAEDYVALWKMENSEGSTNKEVIWYVNYTTDLLLNVDMEDYDGNSKANAFRKEGGNQLHLMFCIRYDFQPGSSTIDLNGVGYQRYATTRRLLSLYNEDIDQRYAGTFREVWMENSGGLKNGEYTEMIEGDTALYLTKKVMPQSFKDRVKLKYQLRDINDLYYEDESLKDNRVFIEMHKHADPTRATAMETRSKRDAFVMRIAEMYLIAAEGEMLKPGGDINKALSYINTLRRTRAYASREAEMEVTTADMNIDFILEERARELVGEQLRWFDLNRTGKLLEYVTKWNPDAKANIKDYHVLRPIPQTQLDAVSNKNDFKQNNGYN